MKPEQSIREFGVEKAREIVERAPEGATHFAGSTYLKLTGAVWWSAWLQEWSHKHNGMVKKWKCESIELIKTWGEVFKLEDLKRLVESLEIIETVGYDRDGAEEIYEFSKDCEVIHYAGLEIKVTRLAQAIRDHESIYGGGDEN